MSKTTRFAYCSIRIASGLAAMSVLACNSSSGQGESCGPGDTCQAGWLCVEGVCREVCNADQDCAKAEACQSGVCVPVADPECAGDEDCDEPSSCQSVLGARCYAGECHYQLLAEGSFCDDDDACTNSDRCDAAGDCSGQAMVCDTPPAAFCSKDDSTFRQYASTGTCNPAQGACEYGFEDQTCADCRHACLQIPVAPTNLVASAGDAQVTLTWDEITEATSYEVYLSESAGDAASAVPVTAAGSPHVQTGLDNGTTYYFAVLAKAEAGEGDLSQEVSATPRISAPIGLVAASGDQQVTIAWDPVAGADTYDLYWSYEPGVTLDANRMNDVTSPYLHASLANGTTYYYALTAVDGPSESELSAEVSATIIDTTVKLVASDAQAYDVFGTSVAISGNYAIVGARSANGGAGAAYVFYYDSDNSRWDAGTKLVAPDAQEGDRFGDAVALSGDDAIVGAYFALKEAGAAYVFHYDRDSSSWDAGAELVAPDAREGDRFGNSVALSGDYAIVGAIRNDGGGVTQAGAAYVFYYDRDSSSWDAGTKLVAPDAQTYDWFGRSVALSGDRAIVGAQGNGTDTIGYAFGRTNIDADTNTWDAGTALVAPDAQAINWFGRSVALSGDYAIVSADNKDGSAAYVFHHDGSSWDSGTKLDSQAGNGFGCSVALSGDYALVGAYYENEHAGAAYVFHYDGSSWDTGTKLVAPDAQAFDWFGTSVTLDGRRAVVGAQQEDRGPDDPTPNAGAAYVFEL